LGIEVVSKEEEGVRIRQGEKTSGEKKDLGGKGQKKRDKHKEKATKPVDRKGRGNYQKRVQEGSLNKKKKEREEDPKGKTGGGGSEEENVQRTFSNFEVWRPKNNSRLDFEKNKRGTNLKFSQGGREFYEIHVGLTSREEEGNWKGAIIPYNIPLGKRGRNSQKVARGTAKKGFSSNWAAKTPVRGKEDGSTGRRPNPRG